ncbi:MAG: putative N-acyltransferase [Gammaproteobacteria bacterium]
MNVDIIASLADVDPAHWNRLNPSGDPFLTHEFLYGLELHNCLKPQGWYGSHLLLRAPDGNLVGAMPLYLRTNSYGEFVFDWAWADAYERAGGKYYPKLVSAVPFTPATGNRLLAANAEDLAVALPVLMNVAIELLNEHQASSLHCLFPTLEQAEQFKEHELLVRTGCQYHWYNRDYTSFDDFLQALNSKRRKQIKRERRDANAPGIEIEVLHGGAITPEHWHVFHEFYCSTFYRKWGEPRLTESFFRYLSQALPDAPLLVLGKHEGEYVAGSFSMRGLDTLYGRHWGCSQHFKQLHFELCYYKTIEFCIEEKLARFDAGAQGEHKMTRGFEPVKTWSAHWIADPRFRDAIAEFLERESQHIDHYVDEISSHKAYKQEPSFDDTIHIST